MIAAGETMVMVVVATKESNKVTYQQLDDDTSFLLASIVDSLFSDALHYH